MLIFIPNILIKAERWKIMLSQSYDLERKESIRLTLSANTFNIFTPSKLGEFTKAYFLRTDLRLGKGFSSILFERVLDMFSLCSLALLGLILVGELNNTTIPVIIFCFIVVLAFILLFFIDFSKVGILNRISNSLMGKRGVGNVLENFYDLLSEIKTNKKIIGTLLVYSLAIWTLNLIQIYFFFLCFEFFTIAIELVFGFVPAAILIGMIPITLFGIGTRDAALIFFFSEFAPIPIIIGVGILSSLRYVILSLAGLPYAREYLGKM